MEHELDQQVVRHPVIDHKQETLRDGGAFLVLCFIREIQPTKMDSNHLLNASENICDISGEFMSNKALAMNPKSRMPKVIKVHNLALFEASSAWGILPTV